jgi:hypothetical protein
MAEIGLSLVFLSIAQGCEDGSSKIEDRNTEEILAGCDEPAVQQCKKRKLCLVIGHADFKE